AYGLPRSAGCRLPGNRGRPENCSASRPSVIGLPWREGILKSGSSVVTGVSRLTVFASTSCASSNAVKVLVTEPISNTVSPSGTRPSASLPKPATCAWPSSTITTTIAGYTPASAYCCATFAMRAGSTAGSAAATVVKATDNAAASINFRECLITSSPFRAGCRAGKFLHDRRQLLSIGGQRAATGWCDAQLGQRTLAAETLLHLDQATRFQFAHVAGQVALAQSAHLFQKAELDFFRTRQHRQDQQPRRLVHQPIQRHHFAKATRRTHASPAGAPRSCSRRRRNSRNWRCSAMPLTIIASAASGNINATSDISIAWCVWV